MTCHLCAAFKNLCQRTKKKIKKQSFDDDTFHQIDFEKMSADSTESSSLFIEEREDTSERRRGAWSVDEHDRYLKAMHLYEAQKDTITEKWKFIQEIIMTRSVQQCRSHHQKYELKVAQLESKRQRQQEQLYSDYQRTQFMHPPQGHHMQSCYHRPDAYPPIYNPHAFHQREHVMMRPYQQQEPYYWSQIPPPPPITSQYQYFTSQTSALPYQRAESLNTPKSMPSSDSSSSDAPCSSEK